MKRHILAWIVLATVAFGLPRQAFLMQWKAANDGYPNVTDGLVAWWKMDAASWDGTAGEVIDSFGDSDGVTKNGTQTADGKINRAGNFIKANQQYITTSTNASVSGFSEVSLSCWIKPNTVTVRGDIFYWFRNVGGSARLVFRIGNDGTGSCGVYARSTDETGSSVYTGNVLSANRWQHIVAVLDLPSDSVKIYVDGTERPTTGAPNWSEDTFVDPVIGKFPPAIGSNPTGAGNWFDGLIDDARIYNRVLTSEEITTIYKWEE